MDSVTAKKNRNHVTVKKKRNDVTVNKKRNDVNTKLLHTERRNSSSRHEQSAVRQVAAAQTGGVPRPGHVLPWTFGVLGGASTHPTSVQVQYSLQSGNVSIPGC